MAGYTSSSAPPMSPRHFKYGQTASISGASSARHWNRNGVRLPLLNELEQGLTFISHIETPGEKARKHGSNHSVNLPELNRDATVIVPSRGETRAGNFSHSDTNTKHGTHTETDQPHGYPEGKDHFELHINKIRNPKYGLDEYSAVRNANNPGEIQSGRVVKPVAKVSNTSWANASDKHSGEELEIKAFHLSSHQEMPVTSNTASCAKSLSDNTESTFYPRKEKSRYRMDRSKSILNMYSFKSIGDSPKDITFSTSSNAPHQRNYKSADVFLRHLEDAKAISARQEAQPKNGPHQSSTGSHGNSKLKGQALRNEPQRLRNTNRLQSTHAERHRTPNGIQGSSRFKGISGLQSKSLSEFQSSNERQSSSEFQSLNELQKVNEYQSTNRLQNTNGLQSRRALESISGHQSTSNIQSTNEHHSANELKSKKGLQKGFQSTDGLLSASELQSTYELQSARRLLNMHGLQSSKEHHTADGRLRNTNGLQSTKGLQSTDAKRVGLPKARKKHSNVGCREQDRGIDAALSVSSWSKPQRSLSPRQNQQHHVGGSTAEKDMSQNIESILEMVRTENERAVEGKIYQGSDSSSRGSERSQGNGRSSESERTLQTSDALINERGAEQGAEVQELMPRRSITVALPDVNMETSD